MAALTVSRPMRCTAISGSSFSSREATAPTRVDHLFKSAFDGVIVASGGTLELSTGSSAASVLTAQQTNVTNRHAVGWQVLVATIPASTGITGGEETERLSYNASVRANTGNWHDGCIDLAADSRLQDPNNTTYFVDGTHFTAAGAGVAKEITMPQLARFGIT